MNFRLEAVIGVIAFPALAAIAFTVGLLFALAHLFALPFLYLYELRTKRRPLVTPADRLRGTDQNAEPAHPSPVIPVPWARSEGLGQVGSFSSPTGPLDVDSKAQQ